MKLEQGRQRGVPAYVDQLIERAIGRSNEAQQLIRSTVGAGIPIGEAIKTGYDPKGS